MRFTFSALARGLGLQSRSSLATPFSRADFGLHRFRVDSAFHVPCRGNGLARRDTLTVLLRSHAQARPHQTTLKRTWHPPSHFHALAVEAAASIIIKGVCRPAPRALVLHPTYNCQSKSTSHRPTVLRTTTNSQTIHNVFAAALGTSATV